MDIERDSELEALQSFHEQDRKNLEAELQQARVHLLAKTQIETELKGVSACQDAERKRLESELENVKMHLAAKNAAAGQCHGSNDWP
jgi:hypothetical protein